MAVQGDCGAEEPYAGHEGALRCLMEQGDVAFMYRDVLLEYVKGGAKAQPWSTLAKAS